MLISEFYPTISLFIYLFFCSQRGHPCWSCFIQACVLRKGKTHEQLICGVCSFSTVSTAKCHPCFNCWFFGLSVSICEHICHSNSNSFYLYIQEHYQCLSGSLHREQRTIWLTLRGRREKTHFQMKLGTDLNFTPGFNICLPAWHTSQ